MLFSGWMLHRVNQLVANFVCQSFGIEQVVYTGFSQQQLLLLGFWEWRDWTTTVKLQIIKQSSELEEAKMVCTAEGTAELVIIICGFVTMSNIFILHVVI